MPFRLSLIPERTTKNRLKDTLYLGWRHKRIRGKDYEEFVDRFVRAIHRRFPDVLLQWEDFAKENAHSLLKKYQEHLCSFNDDIQGTASVTLAGILAAVKVCKSDIRSQQIVIYGAGSAGTGIAGQIVLALKQHGLADEEARERLWMIDVNGLLHNGMEQLAPYQKPFAQPIEKISEMGFNVNAKIPLEEVIGRVHPTILIGVSATPNVFTEKCVKLMAQFTERPIIFPLSNPTSKCEADPNDLIQWTDGKALVATGTQFPDVVYKEKTYKIGQCNNYYIFPAMGLGVISSKATRITSGMF